MPVHWDDFTRPLDQPLRAFPLVVDLDGFFEDMARTRPKVRVMTQGLAEPVSFMEDIADFSAAEQRLIMRDNGMSLIQRRSA